MFDRSGADRFVAESANTARPAQGQLQQLGAPAEVLQWREELHRLSSIQESMLRQAHEDGILHLVALAPWPVKPTVKEDELSRARRLSDWADDDLTLPEGEVEDDES